MISPRNIPAAAAISCILFVTFFIASATEIPASSSGTQSTPNASSSTTDDIPTDSQLRRRRESQDDAQSASDSGENDGVLIIPILIHQRPFFVINEDLPKDLALPEDSPVTASTVQLREVESSDYNDGKVDPDDDWVPFPQQSKGDAGESTTLGYPEVEPLTNMPPIGAIKGNKRYRRENPLPKDDSSESTTQTTGILEIEQWKIGPILVNETNPDTNSSEVGILSVDVVKIDSLPLRKPADGDDGPSKGNPSSYSGAQSSGSQTQPDTRRKRSPPSQRPLFTRRLVQAPFRGKRSPLGCGGGAAVAAASASASSSSSSSNGSKGNRGGGSESNSNAQVQASSG